MENNYQSLQILINSFATPFRIGVIVLLAVATHAAIRRLLPRLRETVVSRQESPDAVQRVHTLTRVLRYTLTVAIGVIAVLSILSELGISVAPLLGAAGVAGIAIGFGAQSLVKDYFSGFFLLLENQIRIGDIIEAGGKMGTVEELTLRYLRLRDYSGNVHYVPNGQITVVTNMSRGFAYAVIDLGIKHDEDVDRVIGAMREVGAELRQDPAFAPKILADLEIAGVNQWADSAVVIRCRFQVAPREQWSVRREYLRRAKAAFDRQGIEMPLPRLKLVRPEILAGA